MADVILIVVILFIVGLAVAYIIKEKKKGRKCIGCPLAANCPSSNAGKGSGACQTNRKATQ